MGCHVQLGYHQARANISKMSSHSATNLIYQSINVIAWACDCAWNFVCVCVFVCVFRCDSCGLGSFSFLNHEFKV